MRAHGGDVLHQPVIQCRDRAAQRRQGRRVRGIGGTETVGLSKQIGLEDGIDHMDMVEDAQGIVVRLGILQLVQGGEGIQQFAVGPGLVAKQRVEGRVAHVLP